MPLDGETIGRGNPAVSEFDYDDEYGNAPKALRDHAKNLEKQLSDLQKKFEDAEKARLAAEKTAKSQTLTSILREKGVKPQLAKWLEKDEVEASPEAVDEWLKENGEFFNVKPTEPVSQEPSEEVVIEGMDNVPPELAAALRASQQLDASGISPSEADIRAKIQSVDVNPGRVNEEQLQEQLRALGVDIG